MTAPKNHLLSLRLELLVCQALRAYVRPLRSDTHPPGRDAAGAWAPGAGSSDAPGAGSSDADCHSRSAAATATLGALKAAAEGDRRP